MKKVIKKTVAKAPVKKTVAKKPMMKSGGPKRSLRKYQGDEGGSEVAPAPSAAPSAAPTTPTTGTTRTLASVVNDNMQIPGMKPARAIRLAKKELGLKKSVDPNAIITAVGNAAGAVGSAVNAFRPQPSGPMGPMKKGGAMKKLGCAQCGGNKMSDGGNTSNRLQRLTKKIDRKTQKGKTVSSGLTRRYDKAVDKVIMSGFKKKTGGATLSKSAIKKAPVQLYGMPQENMGASGQHGFKKGGAQNARLAAIAAPKNKITRRDIITAAKKNAKKK